MIPRKALVVVAALGLLASAGKAHAGWYRVLGGTARQQETNEEFTRRAAKTVKAPPKKFEDHTMRRVEEENRRVMTSTAHKYTPLVSTRTLAAPVHTLASRNTGAHVVTIAERLGGSQGHTLLGASSDRIFKHNANLFLKPSTLFSPWANQWRGGSGTNSNRRIFAFAN